MPLAAGAQLQASLLCTAGHAVDWSSSEDTKCKRTSAAEVNVELVSSIILSGLRYTRLKVGSVCRPTES
jgi:hypothetical protein